MQIFFFHDFWNISCLAFGLIVLYERDILYFTTKPALGDYWFFFFFFQNRKGSHCTFSHHFNKKNLSITTYIHLLDFRARLSESKY